MSYPIEPGQPYTDPTFGGQVEAPATAAEAEVHSETDTGDLPAGALRVTLGSGDTAITLVVPNRRTWRSSALQALTSGRFQDWADATLLERDAVAWEEFDPTVEEVEAFFERHIELSGDNPKGRQPTSFGSRRTKR